MIDPLSFPTVEADAGPFPTVGARVTRNGVHYRVWAPDHRQVRVSVKSARGEWMIEMDAVEDGYFFAIDPAGGPGDRYFFEVDGRLLPDPASGYQPEGVTDASQVVTSAGYNWAATGWKRPPQSGRVIYELHIGAFTPEGTFAAAITKLDFLAALGVNTLELMPLADFPGERNWGYDGVMLFAPARCYGAPDDLRALIDAAHLRGLAVIIDVVYNHIGPSGNVLPDYAQGYFHPEKASMWGKGFDYQNPAVRGFFLQNACMWLDDYRADGLRIDAVHAIEDESPRHLVAEIAEAAHARDAWVIAEDERNEANIIMPAHQNGWGVDGVWADDFHHTTRVALTGQQESHFKSYRGSIDEWVKTLEQGWFYDGRFFTHWNRPRGTPAGHVPPERFVFCISNHDQVGNRPLGDRLHQAVTAEAYRAVSMLLCLVPYTPMIFMGQEWAAGTPFPYFTDLPGDIGENMRENRIKEFAHYDAHYDQETLARMPDPKDQATFDSAKLNWAECVQVGHREMVSLYRECLHLRAREPLFQSPPRDRWSVRQIADRLLGLRWRHPDGDWLLLIGLAGEETAVPANDPFIANRSGRRWDLVFASNDPRFGGSPSWVAWRSDDQGFRIRLPGCVLLHESGPAC
ncbi:MAG TPA: malto-oligosyltrehalose trehalohydrolase [Rariglobus sp.]